jgi:photosystem II stability/assembly factor-like uncharacterized protein
MKRIVFLLPCILLIALLIQPLQYTSAAPNRAATEVVFDFVANASYAQWKSGAGVLPFPGTSGDYRGYAQPVDAPALEDGTTDSAPGLLTVPQSKFNGYIQGVYPEFTVQQNDHFQTIVNCEYRAISCYVTFRLDYITSGGVTRVFWLWKEKNDNQYYRADIDLSPLAGQKVRFILTMLATGSPDGDRALWGAPRIVRPGNGKTPLPSLTPTATPFSTPPPLTPTSCNKAAFVADVTVRDGTLFAPGAAFTKAWRLKNAGSCTWTKDYALVFYEGEQMGAPTLVNLPSTVAPGQTVDIVINAVAPSTPGPHRGDWILRNPSGALFGMGANGANPIWLQINVTGSAPTVGSGYDFVANTCTAQWKSGAGNLPCSGTEGDAKGFVLNPNAPKLEDGTISSSPGLLTMPQSKFNGYIQGTYPTFTVQPGDRFQALVGCEYGASCYVTFRLDYLTPGGKTIVFWQWKEKNEGRYYSADVDLTPLAGQSVRFILTTLATGSPTGDRALWGAPHIARAGGAPPTITPAPPTVTPTPGPIVSSPNIRKLFMIDSTNGWAVSDTYLLRTTNGGLTWYNVTMPGVSSPTTITGGFFPNFNVGWAATNFSDVNVGSLYHTTDGGNTWTHFDVPFKGGYIQFLDDTHGFVMSILDSAMNKQSVALYQTSDGGATWVRNYINDPTIPDAGDSLPLGGHKNGMTFRDISNGWVGGDIPTNGSVYLYKTTDSGVTWSQQPLALPAGYESAFMTTTAPTFFSANEAVLPVWMTLGIGVRDLFIYTSHDGGTTWTASSGFARNGENTDFVSMRDAFSWDWAGFFHVTHDSGTTWTQVQPNVDFGDSIRDMDFVSTTIGWMLDADLDGNIALYRTTDGGYTWTLLFSNQPAATSTPGPTSTSSSGLVTDVTISDTVASVPSCSTTSVQVDLTGTITTNGPAIVTYHWEIMGDAVQMVLPNASFPFSGAMSQTVGYVFNAPCGSHAVLLIVTSPNEMRAQVNIPLYPPTPTPVALMGPYAVMNVAPNNVLNIRSGTGVSYPIIGSFAPDAVNVMRTGNTASADFANWVEVQNPNGGTGWVNDYYLTEYVTSNFFVADSRLSLLIDKLKQAMNNSDGNLFASLISPKHGVSIVYHGNGGPSMIYLPDQARDVFTSTQVIDWGAEGATGNEAVGTFSRIIRPKLLDVLNATYELHPNDPQRADMYPQPWPDSYKNLNFFSVLKPASPNVVFDWREWLVGIEYVNGQPYIMMMSHFVNEP